MGILEFLYCGHIRRTGYKIVVRTEIPELPLCAYRAVSVPDFQTETAAFQQVLCLDEPMCRRFVNIAFSEVIHDFAGEIVRR